MFDIKNFSPKIKKILVINPFGIGDVLFTTPLLQNLHDAFPNALISYLGNKRTKVVLQHIPLIDSTFVYEKDVFRILWKKSKVQCVREFFELLQTIKNEKFDLVIDLSLGRFYSFFMMLLGIPHRWGLSYKKRGVFLTRKIEFKGYEKKHVVSHYYDFMKSMGIVTQEYPMSIEPSPTEVKWKEKTLLSLGILDKTIIVVAPGGGGSWGKDGYRKQWSAKKYTAVIEKLLKDTRIAVVLVGDDNDRVLCDEINDAVKDECANLCGKTTIGRLIALFQHSQLVLCNDGGILHLAVASKIKTVSIFGPVDENVYGPYPKDQHKVITANIDCRPCYQSFSYQKCDTMKCLENIDPEEVYTQVKSLLKK